MMPVRIILACAACLVLSGCYADPFNNPADWSATGATRENLAQQTADKSDLIQGKSDPYSSGVPASAAIDKALGGSAGNASGLQTPPPSIVTSSGG